MYIALYIPFLNILYELNGELIWEGWLGFGMNWSERDNGEDEWGEIWIRTRNLCVLERDDEWGGSLWKIKIYSRVGEKWSVLGEDVCVCIGWDGGG